MPLQDFDARSVQPQQGMDKHPVGMFDFQITNTFLKPSNDEQYLMLMLELTSPAGRITRNYIVDAQHPTDATAKTIETANKQLSAMCHAVNIHRVSYPKDQNGNPLMDQAARELRGGRGRMEVAFQKGHEPTAENPAGGYVEVRKVFDAAGNEPGKSGGAPQVQQAAQQPPQGQLQGANAAQQAPMTAQNGGGWATGAAAPQQQPPANNAQNGGWQPGPNTAPAQPPWGKQ